MILSFSLSKNYPVSHRYEKLSSGYKILSSLLFFEVPALRTQSKQATTQLTESHISPTIQSQPLSASRPTSYSNQERPSRRVVWSVVDVTCHYFCYILPQSQLHPSSFNFYSGAPTLSLLTAISSYPRSITLCRHHQSHIYICIQTVAITYSVD